MYCAFDVFRNITMTTTPVTRWIQRGQGGQLMLHLIHVKGHHVKVKVKCRSHHKGLAWLYRHC